jgi:hypothetical protein
MRTAEGNDALAYVNQRGRASPNRRLKFCAAECVPDTPAKPRHEKHHDLVRSALSTSFRRKARGGSLAARAVRVPNL